MVTNSNYDLLCCVRMMRKESENLSFIVQKVISLTADDRKTIGYASSNSTPARGRKNALHSYWSEQSRGNNYCFHKSRQYNNHPNRQRKELTLMNCEILAVLQLTQHAISHLIWILSCGMTDTTHLIIHLFVV